ncbi:MULTISPECIES: DUF3489 domain-containing protein [Sphingomonas]|uniref:DUF3489 domain-containing protein n=1 Tax=Sphingomonas TaxID=13687 RepID=UPI000DEF679B|nr:MULTISPECIES: DUF3489 domain-containing protein [Sphingomonas]
MPKTKKMPSKSEILRKLLTRERGATVPELCKAAAWQEHSVRAFLSGVRKTAEVVKEQRSDGAISYRLVPKPAAVTAEDLAA